MIEEFDSDLFMVNYIVKIGDNGPIGSFLYKFVVAVDNQRVIIVRQHRQSFLENQLERFYENLKEIVFLDHFRNSMFVRQ